MDIRKIIQNLLGIADKDMPEGKELQGFTAEQLTEARTLAQVSFQEAKDARELTAAREATETLEAIVTEEVARAQADADLEAELAELETRVTTSTTEPEVVEPVEPEPVVEPVIEPEVTPEPVVVEVVPEPVIEPVAPVTEPVQVAASVTPITKPRAVPAPSKQVTTKPKSTLTITAAADVQGHSAGTVLTEADLGPAFVGKAEALAAGRHPGKLSVAKIKVEYPEERRLSSNDSTDLNTEKIHTVLASVQERSRKNLDALMAATSPMDIKTLTAEGGLCAPVNVRYDICTMGTDVRPIRDGVTRFGATRGGIQFNAPPVLTDVAGSTQVVLESEDAAGTGYPKDCIRVDCGDLVTVKVSAVTLCMEVGNFQRLSFPENFNAWWALGKVAHARLAEETLWARMKALSTHVTDAEGAILGLGFARTLLAGVARATQQFRDRFRTGDDMILRAFIPSWAITLAQVDFLRQSPGDNAVALAKSTIARYFAAFNVAVSFVLDGQPSLDTGTYTQAAGSLHGWPANLDIIVAQDGAFLFTDMGELNFGTEIRDFDQIRNNDSGAFFETFENLANVCAGSLWVTFEGICASGKTSAPEDITCSQNY